MVASAGLFYFEVTVVSTGREGGISVGICGARSPLNRLPGWSAISFGYHAQNGLLFLRSTRAMTAFTATTSADQDMGSRLVPLLGEEM